MKKPTLHSLLGEFIIKTSRSSGAGGQNVNKVNSKVTLKWSIPDSQVLDPEQKEFLHNKLKNRLTTDGVLILSSQDSRSQVQNKESALAKVDKLLTVAFTRKKIRKPTKPSKASKNKRVQDKKHRAEKKEWRRKI